MGFVVNLVFPEATEKIQLQVRSRPALVPPPFAACSATRTHVRARAAGARAIRIAEVTRVGRMWAVGRGAGGCGGCQRSMCGGWGGGGGSMCLARQARLLQILFTRLTQRYLFAHTGSSSERTAFTMSDSGCSTTQSAATSRHTGSLSTTKGVLLPLVCVFAVVPPYRLHSGSTSPCVGLRARSAAHPLARCYMLPRFSAQVQCPGSVPKFSAQVQCWPTKYRARVSDTCNAAAS